SFVYPTSHSISRSFFLFFLLFPSGFSSPPKFLDHKCCHSPARCRRRNSDVCDAIRTHDSGLSFFAACLIRFFQVSREPIERSLPELSILLDPLRGFF